MFRSPIPPRDSCIIRVEPAKRPISSTQLIFPPQAHLSRQKALLLATGQAGAVSLASSSLLAFPRPPALLLYLKQIRVRNLRGPLSRVPPCTNRHCWLATRESREALHHSRHLFSPFTSHRATTKPGGGRTPRRLHSGPPFHQPIKRFDQRLCQQWSCPGDGECGMDQERLRAWCQQWQAAHPTAPATEINSRSIRVRKKQVATHLARGGRLLIKRITT